MSVLSRGSYLNVWVNAEVAQYLGRSHTVLDVTVIEYTLQHRHQLMETHVLVTLVCRIHDIVRTCNSQITEILVNYRATSIWEVGGGVYRIIAV